MLELSEYTIMPEMLMLQNRFAMLKHPSVIILPRNNFHIVLKAYYLSCRNSLYCYPNTKPRNRR